MKTRLNKRDLSIAILGGSLLMLGGCLHDNEDERMSTYKVSVTNITNGQPLTPVAVIAHHSNYQAWQEGAMASTGLEMLAESGDPGAFLSAADASADVTVTGASANGPFGPGATESVTVISLEASDLEISVATMLANTNDAFTGLSKVAVGGLAIGDSVTMLSHVYDAGTESNSETAATMPGPAAGGEGFNAARDDGDFISIHAGVVTSDDGLATSALDESHRWLGSAAKVVISRTQ